MNVAMGVIGALSICCHYPQFHVHSTHGEPLHHDRILLDVDLYLN